MDQKEEEKTIEDKNKINLGCSPRLMVVMIIKGLFRRYKRWNPVHPTSGAFWGMGLGIGCGVGWGPGFGPEVVGYVGAGCGIGFSVGITLAGFGIGLPANFFFQLPYNAINATKSGALATTLSNASAVAGDGWNYIAPQVFGLHREATERFSSFKQKYFLEKGVGTSDAKSMLPAPVKYFWGGLERFGFGFFHPHKGVLQVPFSMYLIPSGPRLIFLLLSLFLRFEVVNTMEKCQLCSTGICKACKNFMAYKFSKEVVRLDGLGDVCQKDGVGG